MDRRVAKELLHIRDWLSLADDILMRGRDAYSADGLMQEAGDSLKMKLGEPPTTRAGRSRTPTGDGLDRCRRQPQTGSSTSTTRSTAHSRGSLCRATWPVGERRSPRPSDSPKDPCPHRPTSTTSSPGPPTSSHSPSPSPSSRPSTSSPPPRRTPHSPNNHKSPRTHLLHQGMVAIRLFLPMTAHVCRQ